MMKWRFDGIRLAYFIRTIFTGYIKIAIGSNHDILLHMVGPHRKIISPCMA